MQTSSPSPSPPDFDFNLPCRYFKSSFARSLSMHNGGAGLNDDDANDMQCKSLDFNIGPYRKISTFNNSNNDIQNIDTKSLECPPLPQRRPAAYTTATKTTTTSNKNEAASKYINTNKNNNSNNNMAYYESDLSDESIEEDLEKPPAIPARCPVVVVPKSKSAGALNLQLRHQPQAQIQQQQQHQQLLAQFRHVAIGENANASGNAVAGAATTTTTNGAATVNAAHGNFNRPINHNNKQHQPQQQHLNCQAKSHQSSNNNNNSNDSLNSTRIGKSRCNLSNRRNVWPTDRDGLQQQQQQHQHQQQQQKDHLLFDVEDDVHIEVDNNSVGCLMNATPPVAATRSTLTPHYAAGASAATTKTNIALTPKAVARPTPPCIEQQQRLNAFKAYNDNATTTATTTTTTTTNVQVVLLQNQVDTLQWQLKQVETSNEMYRAVIEEIARFLDRYLTQKQQQPQLQQQQQISRSKSLFQVYDGNNSNCEGHEENTSGDIDTFNDKSIASTASSSSSTACLRTRSTSNLITDLKHATTKPSNTNTKHTTLATTVVEQKRSCDAINIYNNNNNSYTAFKDFTWRRSPKKCAESKALAAANEIEEKLNKEAFRLSRTIQNLLNTSTGQPDLTQHRGALATSRTNTQPPHSKLPQVLAPPHTATPTLPIPPPQATAHAGVNGKPNATSASMNRRALPPHNANSLANSHSTAEMLFLRANNIRDSRISLRSSTDSSVHSTISNSSVVSSSSSSAASTSSGKVETDDDITLHHPFHALALPFKQLQHPLSSATEDESGFSSISSFQDIGVPLCSTMISNGTSTPNRLSLASVKLDSVSLSSCIVGGGGGGGTSGGGSVCDIETNEFVGGDSRNSTLKANHPSNVLGVPLQATHDMQHRWDTTTSTTTKTNYRSANKYQRFSTLSNEDAAAVLWV